MLERIAQLGGEEERGVVWGVHLSHLVPSGAASAAPGLAVLPTAHHDGFSPQDGNMGGRRKLRPLTGPIAAGQPIRPDEYTVTWFAAEIPLSPDRAVVFPCRDRTLQVIISNQKLCSAAARAGCTTHLQHPSGPARSVGYPPTGVSSSTPTHTPSANCVVPT